MHTLRAARDEEHILRAATTASAKDLFYLQRLRHEAAHAPRRLRPTRPPPLPEIAPDSDRLWPPLPARRDGLQRLSVVLDAARRDGLLMRRGTALSSSMQRGGKVEGDGPATPPVSSASSSRSTLAVSSASSSRSTIAVSSASSSRSTIAVSSASSSRSSIAVSSSSPASSASATRSLAAVGQAVGFSQAVLHAASQHTGRVLVPDAPLPCMQTLTTAPYPPHRSGSRARGQPTAASRLAAAGAGRRAPEASRLDVLRRLVFIIFERA
jgi:hypothetical protein